MQNHFLIIIQAVVLYWGIHLQANHQIKQKAQFQCKTPEESVEKYKEYLIEKINNKDKEICDELNKLYLRCKTSNLINLVCYCVTETNNICHGQIIKQIIESKLK